MYNKNQPKLVNKYRFNYSMILWKEAFTKNKTGYFVKMFWKNDKETIKIEFLIKDDYLSEFDDKRNIITVPYHYKTKYSCETVNPSEQWKNDAEYEETTFSEIFRIIAENNTKYPHEMKQVRQGK